jgi:hypothetical protein
VSHEHIYGSTREKKKDPSHKNKVYNLSKRQAVKKRNKSYFQALLSTAFRKRMDGDAQTDLTQGL